MSVAVCGCGIFVDTDDDGDFYFQSVCDGKGKCASCRGE